MKQKRHEPEEIIRLLREADSSDLISHAVLFSCAVIASMAICLAFCSNSFMAW